MFRKSVSSAVISAASLAVVGGMAFATPAYAAGPPPYSPCSIGKGGKACFQAKGDKIWLLDKKKDGNYVRAFVRGQWGNPKDCKSHKGKGHWKVCNYNWPESATVGFSVAAIKPNGSPQSGASGPEQTAPVGG